MKTLPTVIGLVLACVVLASSAGAATPAPAVKTEKKYVPYKITRGDTLSVSVLGEPDLSVAQKRVEPTGTVSLPLIQNVRLHGLTINEAQDAICRAYRDGRFLRNPVVTVTVEVYSPRRVIVGGKVNNTGSHEIPADVEFTIKELIAKAGGFSDTARGTKVTVTRMMPDGKPHVFTLDVESALKGRASNNDAEFVLEPEDTIYVPEKII